MELIFYVTIFIIGALLGSFFTLAVYRIPLKKDITHERSYCPKCNHRLEFFDLIPVLSYIFLGGKCRYCKEKIRPRYLILEICSGIVFLLFMMSLRLNFFFVKTDEIIYLIFGILYISTLFIIGGIEKEYHNISKPVLLFGVIIEIIYMIYLYIIKNSIYKYVIYLILLFVILLFIFNKKYNEKYWIQILSLVIYIAIASSIITTIYSIILSLLLLMISNIRTNRKNTKENIANEKNIDKIYNIGFYLCSTNILFLIIQNYI